MCGIFFCLGECQYDLEKNGSFRNRGPDSYRCEQVTVSSGVLLNFCSSVLSMRGETPCQQPIGSPNGDILCYNGNIWTGLKFSPNDNDTRALIKSLSDCETESNVVELLSSVQGPLAIVFFQRRTGKLFFMRDVLGRKSLLWSGENDFLSFSLSSVAVDQCKTYHELPSGIIFSIDFTEDTFQTRAIPLRPLEFALFEPIEDFLSNHGTFEVLSHYADKTDLKANSEKIFRLDRKILSLDSDYNELSFPKEELFHILGEKLRSEVECFVSEISDSVRKRVNSRQLCRNCSSRKECIGHSKIAILFSGGVDSLLVAAICHLVMDDPTEPIDVLNVAFAETSEHSFSVPDRELGLKAWKVLQSLYPERKWHFVRINVSKGELAKFRSERVAPLLLPCRTVLDDSLGCAMWFGARGQGTGGDLTETYFSPAKVLLLGSGADELLAGYSRHRARFERDGLLGLLDELEMELGRISNRNLGRDDRICSDHGREARLPFLDENLISFLNSLPISAKTDLKLPRGLGEKLILRLALWKLGFGELSFSAKRAMQFGSRIAKLENRSERADQLCSRLVD